MPDIVVRGKAHGENIRAVMTPQLFGHQSMFGELFDNFVAPVGAFKRAAIAQSRIALCGGAERLVAGLGIHRHPFRIFRARRRFGSIRLRHPRRQFLHVVSTGHPVSRWRIEPISSVRHVAGGQNGASVFDRNADHFHRLTLHLDFVAERAHGEAARGGSDAAPPPTSLVSSSETLVTVLRAARSYQVS